MKLICSGFMLWIVATLTDAAISKGNLPNPYLPSSLYFDPQQIVSDTYQQQRSIIKEHKDYKECPSDLRCSSSNSPIPFCLAPDLERDGSHTVKPLGLSDHASIDLYITKEGNYYAVKTFPLKRHGRPTRALREIYILKEMHHPNIISLYRVDMTKQFIRYWMPFTLGSLANYIMTARELFEKEKEYMIKQIMRQLLSGLNYLKYRNVVHLNIQPATLMVGRLETDNLHIFISGFGKAYLPSSDNPGAFFPGSISYAAPEHISGGREYQPSSDIWSAGVVMAELAFGVNIFKGANDLDILANIQKYIGSMPVTQGSCINKFAPIDRISLPMQALLDNSGLSVKAKDLMMRLLRYNPNERLTSLEALRHPFFDCHKHFNPIEIKG